MRFWIDCEWNSYKGELISMALVGGDGYEWYEVTHCENPDSWVAQHVIPILCKSPVSLEEMRLSLHDFLSAFDSAHIIADWPEDIAHFCNFLITGPGTRIDYPCKLTFEIRDDLDSVSALPHNALEDARANMLKQLELEGK